jgi:flagellar M-ring protein FliF
MDALSQLLKTMGASKVAALIATGMMMLVLFFFITSRVATSPLSPLYSDLSLEDSGKVVGELERLNVKYELRANGTQIVVPNDQVLRLRLTMAQQGIPSGGSIVGYEIFDRSEAMGTSSFVMNINMLRALEGELARTISNISQVESARVHLVIPKPELFKQDRVEPTASVMLKLRGVSELEKIQIQSISNLIATAVPGLKPSKVTIIDSKGALLAGGAGDAHETGAAATTAESFRTGFEVRLKNTLESLLEKSVGTGKVKVTVNADIDFDRVVTNSEVFDPNGQVARSVQTGEEKELASEKEGRENTTVANNLPNNQATQNNSGSNRTIEKTDETTNFEISKTVTNQVQESGKVKKLSVAVLVDGNYTKDTEGKEIYTARTDEERKQLETLVKSAVGYDEKRGDKVDVVNMRFIPADDISTKQTMLEWFKEVFPGLLQTLVYGGIALVVIFLVIRPLIKRIIESTLATSGTEELVDQSSPLLALQGAAGGGAGAPRLAQSGAGGGGAAPPMEQEEEASVDLSRVTGRVKSSTVNRLNELVEKHPDEALSVVRQWASRRT